MNIDQNEARSKNKEDRWKHLDQELEFNLKIQAESEIYETCFHKAWDS